MPETWTDTVALFARYARMLRDADADVATVGRRLCPIEADASPAGPPGPGQPQHQPAYRWR